MVKKLISVWLSVTILLFSTITIFAEEKVVGEFLNRNIDINGNRITNYYLEDPFFLYQGMAYVPLTKEVGEILGFTAEMDLESHTLKISEKTPSKVRLTENKLKSNLNNLPGTICQDLEVLFITKAKQDIDNASEILDLGIASLISGTIEHLQTIKDRIESETIDVPEYNIQSLDTKEYPLIEAGKTYYIPARAFSVMDGFEWDAFFDNYSGLYISTEKGVDAKSFFDKKESDYNRGLANYIVAVNKNISPGWAAMLVFLFKHEAEINGLDEKLIMAMAQKESTFRADVVAKGGSVGLMQIMPKTAAAYGISRDQLLDPHVNIEFGAKYIKSHLNQYKNNKTIALSAYNQGSGAVSRGSYTTRYATNVTGTEKNISQYLKNNGYGLGD